MKNINKPTAADYTYAAVKAGLGSVPIVGAAASELLGLIVAPPLEVRRQQWMTEVGVRLQALEAKGLDLQSLSTNEQFIDTVAQASNLVLKTSERAKIAAFQNAVIHTAIGEAPEKTVSQIFLNLIDAFTVWHIKILHFIDNPREWYSRANAEPPQVMIGSISRILTMAFPELQGQDELMEVIWNDLKDAGLHRTGSIMATMSGAGMMDNRTTDLGKLFLEFISDPEDV